MDGINADDPPDSTDLPGWRKAVDNKAFRDYRMEAITAAIQDPGPNTDTTVLNPLVLHASDAMVRILRRKVGKNHRNDGEDIITDAHGKLIKAMLDPTSADGKGLRIAFVPRI